RGIGSSQTTDSPVQLKDVTIERAFDGAAVTVKTSGPTQYEAKLIDSPTRLVIDLTGATYSSSKSRWMSGVDPVKEVRGSQWRKGVARVVVEMNRADVGYRIDETPDGLVIAVENSNGRSPETKIESAKLTNGVSDTSKMVAPKPIVVASAKPAEKITPVASGTDTVMDTPKAAPKPMVVAEAKPADKPAPAASAAPASKEPPAPVRVPAVAAATPAPAAVVAPPAPARPVLAQATTPPAPVAPARPMVAQATPTPPPPPAASTPATGEKLISLDFKDADVVNLLRILAAESGRNIVAGDDVKGRVSISLKNVTWEQALDTILEVRGLAKVERDSVIRIVSIEQLTKEKEALARVESAKRNAEIETRTKMAEAQLKETELATRKLAADAAAAEAQARGPLREEVIRLSYADPVEVAATLQGILGIPPEGVQVPATPLVPGVPANPTVIPSGSGPLNPELGRLPQINAPFPPPIQPAVQSISQDVLNRGITVRANKATNSIFIRHFEADLERLKKLIREQLDVPLPQIKIEARMEILDRNSLEAIGVQWGGATAGAVGNSTLIGQGFQGSDVVRTGIAPSNFSPSNPNLSLASLLPVAAGTGLSTGGNLVNLPFGLLPNASTTTPAGGIAFGIVGTRFNINLALQALATLGKTRTLAHPEIVTVENNKAAFTLGEEIPYATVSSAGTQVQFKEAVLKLEVTPTVIRETIDGQEIRKVKMTVIVENNSRGDVISPAAGVSVPIINRRKAETQVLVREGDRLVIGGVTQNVQQKTIRKVPLMGDVPILGWLFKQREDFETGRELVVFMTPSILKTDGIPAAAPRR
ncbi:MAG TPA: AMIN domain-containing protein, partial [Methylomirabilota bacterium]|nr:AMIN domain-containing protein [Methylomirabilota bacterium]